MDNLLVSSILGMIWLVLLFSICFFGVHILRLAKMGQRYRKAEKEKKETQEEKTTPPKTQPSPPPTEPVYYIVERKKRVKSNYSEPKQIHFK